MAPKGAIEIENVQEVHGAIDIKDGSEVQKPAPVNVNDTPEVEEMIAEVHLPITLEKIKPRAKKGRW